MDKIVHDTDRDFYLSATQAIEYGIVDEILGKPPEEKPKKEAKPPKEGKK
jgi:ATP-dependent Clp protease protease subunit